jgi:hypothetical protein
MKYPLFVIALSFSFSAFAGSDYILNLDGKPFEMSLDTATNIVLKDGQKISATLTKKEIVTFETSMFSFEHPGTVSPQRIPVEDHIFQTSYNLQTAGVVILIQEYERLDAAAVVDTMVEALTKEEVKAGYKLSTEKATKRLADGTVLTGKKAVTTLKDQQWIRYILGTSGRNEGVLVITQIALEDMPEGGPGIESFWKSLRVKKTKAE